MVILFDSKRIFDWYDGSDIHVVKVITLKGKMLNAVECVQNIKSGFLYWFCAFK